MQTNKYGMSNEKGDWVFSFTFEKWAEQLTFHDNNGDINALTVQWAQYLNLLLKCKSVLKAQFFSKSPFGDLKFLNGCQK